METRFEVDKGVGHNKDSDMQRYGNIFCWRFFPAFYRLTELLLCHV
jgi:hypothetical protein